MLDVLNALVKAIESREPVALTTVIDVQGASPAGVGFKRLGSVGNVGGYRLFTVYSVTRCAHRIESPEC
jgi:xanthine/CO dehydrogenase XdhC/CoxF family maturation factor